MTPISPRGSVLTIGIVLIGFYSAFSLGALTGANVAMDDSKSVEDVQTELATAESESKSNLSEDYTGVRSAILEPMVVPVVGGAWTAAEWGVGFGSAAPRAAAINGHLSPFIILGGMVAVLYHHLQKLRRITQ